MYQIPELLRIPKLFHAFSEKADSNLDFRFGNSCEVLDSRKKFLSRSGIDLSSCAVLNVQHSDHVVTVDSKLVGRGTINLAEAIKADCLITNKRNVLLFLLVADCAPIILYDPVKESLGLVHSGWKGADLNIVSKAIKRLSDLFGTKPKDLKVGIGPAARKDSFIKENPSQKDDPKWKGFIEGVGDGKYKVDFVGLCKKQLAGSGVLKENIFDCKIDTFSEERFFSHIRDGKLPINKQGRFACVVGLK